MRLLHFFSVQLDQQRGHLFVWSPVAMGIGVALYFAMLYEPGQFFVAGCIGLGLAALIASWRAKQIWSQAVAIGLFFLVFGFAAAMFRSWSVAGPVLSKPIYSALEGRVVWIDRSGSGAMRFTLDQVQIAKTDQTPRRVRVSVLSAEIPPLFPGDRIALTAMLSPPEGAVEPYGFDFQRYAWFQSLGAIGFARAPPVLVGHASSGWVQLDRFRMRVSAWIQTKFSANTAGVATAIITGDRSAIPAETLTALRRSNLAHLLAISGLHMGLLTGFVFAITRGLLALSPRLAEYHETKIFAAFAALISGFGYLLISGGNIATQRAFIMVAVMLVGMILGRRSFGLRQVGVAGLIILALYPESLLGPGFQMSFAATIALITVFTALRDLRLLRENKLLAWAIGLFLSSFIAGLATAPFSAIHFNMLTQYGLLANLLSVPVMGVLVMPSAVGALVTAPFGLDALGWAVMDWGLRWILYVAQMAAEAPGAIRPVHAPMPIVLPLIAFGGLLLCLWQGRARFCALLPLGLGLFLWVQSERPLVLIAARADLVGYMTEQGRALSQLRAGRFAGIVWAENDAAPLSREAAFSLWQERAPDWLVHLHRKREINARPDCAPGSLVVVNRWRAPLWRGPCFVLDRRKLNSLGSLAIYRDAESAPLRVIARHEVQGTRPWSRRRDPRVIAHFAKWAEKHGFASNLSSEALPPRDRKAAVLGSSR